MTSLIEDLKGQENRISVERILSYSINIEEDEIIDYILFSFDNELRFSLCVDSSAENMIFISYEKLLEKIKFSGFKYKLTVELDKKELFKKIHLKYNDVHELNSILFVFEKAIFTITIGMDCLILDKKHYIDETTI